MPAKDPAKYMAARRAAKKDMKEAAASPTAPPFDQAAVFPNDPENITVTAKKAFPITAAEEESLGGLMARLPPDAQEALLLGIRTGSPDPWRNYLARRARRAD